MTSFKDPSISCLLKLAVLLRNQVFSLIKLFFKLSFLVADLLHLSLQLLLLKIPVSFKRVIFVTEVHDWFLHLFKLFLTNALRRSHQVGRLQVNFLILFFYINFVSLDHFLDLNFVELAFQFIEFFFSLTQLTRNILKLAFGFLVFFLVAFDNQITLCKVSLYAYLLLKSKLFLNTSSGSINFSFGGLLLLVGLNLLSEIF